MEFLVLRPPVLVRGCLIGLVFLLDKQVARMPRIATPVVTDIIMT